MVQPETKVIPIHFLLPTIRAFGVMFTRGDERLSMSTSHSGQGFPQMLADAAHGSIIRRQSLSWMPAFLAPFFLLFAYGGFFHQRPGYEKAGHIAGSVCLALGAICVYLEWSRRRKRITLCFHNGMVGLYRRGEFHYAFREEQFVPYELHPFNTGRMVLITGALAVGCLALFIFDKKATPMGPCPVFCFNRHIVGSADIDNTFACSLRLVLCAQRQRRQTQTPFLQALAAANML
jgi:hypothetical protein